MNDISDFAASDTAVMTVKNPVTDEPLLFDGEPALITMFGPGSAEAAAYEALRNNRIMAIAKANGGKVELSAEEQTRQRIDRLVALTKGIDNLPYAAAGDKTGADLARAIYSDRKIGFVANQAETFANGWKDFIGGSVTN